MTKMAIFGQKSVQKKLDPNNGGEIWDETSHISLVHNGGTKKCHF
jgi:hypothetical protein